MDLIEYTNRNRQGKRVEKNNRFRTESTDNDQNNTEFIEIRKV